MNERSKEPLKEPMELVEKIAYELIQPLLVERAVPNENGELDVSIETIPEDEHVLLSAVLDQRHGIVGQIRVVDEVHAKLQLGFVAGRALVPDNAFAVQLAYFLDGSGFNVRFDGGLTSGYVAIDSEIYVREDDDNLVERHLLSAIELANQVEWFSAMMFPQLLPAGEQVEVDAGNVAELLEEMFGLPPTERDADWMFSVVRGLGRWQDMLKILRQHPELMEEEYCERYRMLALRMLGRWQEARKAAEMGGIVEGKFIDAPWLSPSYLEILIHLDDGIEVLRLLSEQNNGEPDFYDVYRARAYLSLDMMAEADEAFTRYMVSHRGDLASLMQYSELRGELTKG